MTWVRIDDGAPLHPKLLDAGPEAAWLWACGLAYCNRNHTDGLISRRHLAALYPGAWGAEEVQRLAERLVGVRLWDREGIDFRVHDYAHYQEEATREVVDARRIYERDRKRAQRLKGRPGHVPDNVPGTTAGHVPGTTAGTEPGTEHGTQPADMPVGAPVVHTHAPVVPAPRPVPSRPVPVPENSESDLVTAPLRDASTQRLGGASPGPDAAAKAEAKEARRREAVAKETAKAEARAKREAEWKQRRDDKERAKAERERQRIERLRALEADEAKREPLPFKPWEAVRTIAAHAGGRFIAGIERDMTGGYAIALTAHIRAYPTLAEWQTLGRWLAGGDHTYSGTLGIAWAASGALRDGMARARAWADVGPAPEARRGHANEAPRPVPSVVNPAPSARVLSPQDRATLARGLREQLSLAPRAAAEQVVAGG